LLHFACIHQHGRVTFNQSHDSHFPIFIQGLIMKKTTKYFVAVSGFILSAGLAYADGAKCDSPMHNQSSVSQQGIMFKTVDTNGNGSISKSEFNAFYAKHNAKHFKEMDANKDGKITPGEMQGEHRQEMGHNDGTTHLDQRFKAADANDDGGLNKKEANAMPMLNAYFEQVDANKDGKVTRQEYLDAMPLLHRGKQMDSGGKAQTL
jgi:Ca2+-binding EF-hand superfamily protein